MNNQIPFYHERHHTARLLRDLLVEHMDGAEVDRSAAPRQSRRRLAFNILLDRMLIETIPESPEFTRITERGREELGKLLADYAECLLRLALIQADRRNANLDQVFALPR